MLTNYFNITVIAEWGTFVLALLFLDRKTGIWRFFILLLFANLCAETTGWFMRTKLHYTSNALPFNVLTLLATPFFIWFFSKTNSLQKLRPILIFVTCLFVSFGVVNLLSFQGFWYYNSFTETLGDLILSVICCYFIYSILSQQEYTNLLASEYFWLATGILFSSLGSALLYQFSYALREFYLHSKIDVGTYINYGLNLILYSSLIVAFVCRWKSTRS